MKIVTAKEIADALSISKRNVSIRAKREEWKFEILAGRGGNIPHFHVSALPMDVKNALFRKYKGLLEPTEQGEKLGKLEHEKAAVLAAQDAETKLEAVKKFASYSGNAARSAEVAFLLLKMADSCVQGKITKMAAWNEFVHLYNNRQLDLESYFYEVKNRISYKTLTRWEKAYREQGIVGLVPKYGKNKGKGVIDSTPGMREYCIALIHQFPHIKGARLAELLEMKFQDAPHLPAAPTCRSWLQKWKQENKATFMSLVDPSGWQNNHMAAFGSKSASVERINQLWEFDSTPADVMLKDGRYSIVGVIDVFTRRVKLVLKPTSNAEGIALLIRNAILDWGVPEVARTDNGSDYLSAHVVSIWDALNIKNDVTNPYSGWEKPFIERFFRTFSHGLAELVAGYIGHNVSDREKISARLTFAERLLQKREKGADRVAIDVSLTADDFEAFMNSWLDNYYLHFEHRELGCSPFEKYTQHSQAIKRLDDERILDVLLAPVPSQRGFRTVGKEGISVEGMMYIHAELGAYVGERVFCRYNPDDVGKIYVFNALHNNFICEAVNPEIAGNDITMAHAMEAKRIQRARLREQREIIRKSSRKNDVSDAAMQLLQHKAAQNGSLTDFPKPSSQIDTQAITSVSQIKLPEQSGFTDEQKDRFAKRRQELEAMDDIHVGPTFKTEFHKARHYIERNLQGLLTPTEKAWLHQFRHENKRAAEMLDKLFNQTKEGK